MAKILTKEEKARETLADAIYGEMRRQHINGEQISDELNIARQTFFRRLKDGTLTFNQLVYLFKRLGMDDANKFLIV